MFLCNDIVLFQEIYRNLSQKARNLLLLLHATDAHEIFMITRETVVNAGDHRLEPDVAGAFPTERAVNDALRLVMKLTKVQKEARPGARQ